MSQPIHVPPVITSIREDGTKNVFISHEKLGHGGFATVYRVTHQNTNKDYAMKVISKERYISSKGKSSLDKLKNEIQIQKSLNHPNIVQSKLSFSDELNYYIALEYCPGKTIRAYLRSSLQGRLTEAETRKILRDVINGLVFLHNRRIIHHDLKLENFIIGADGKVKIADFGLATFHKNDDEKNLSICGTPNYMSPEILLKRDKGSGFETDIWAIGVAAFIMLTGRPPFGGIAKETVYENIKNCIFTFPSNFPISFEARDFINSILRFDPLKRPTAADLLSHPFLTKYDSEPVKLYNPIQSYQKVSTSSSPIQFSQKAMTPQRYSPATKNETIKKKSFSSLNSYNLKLGQTSPQISSLNNIYNPARGSSNLNLQIVSSRVSDDSESAYRKIGENKEVNNFNSNIKKNFTVPSSVVTKYCFVKDDLCYLLGNGTVGICFEDKSRIVMDPKEEFVQLYTNYNSLDDVIELDDSVDLNDEIHDKITLVKKFARAFKKFTNLYETARTNSISSIPLQHVSYFMKKDDAVVFKLNNKNVQVNFGDSKKLVIFWNTKKMCIFKNIKEKCCLFDPNDVSRMNSNSDELRKYKRAKEMINTMTRNI